MSFLIPSHTTKWHFRDPYTQFSRPPIHFLSILTPPYICIDPLPLYNNQKIPPHTKMAKIWILYKNGNKFDPPPIHINHLNFPSFPPLIWNHFYLFINEMAIKDPSYKNCISRPLYNKWHFQYPHTKILFLRPHHTTKWHFRDYPYKTIAFSIPPLIQKMILDGISLRG